MWHVQCESKSPAATHGFARRARRILEKLGARRGDEEVFILPGNSNKSTCGLSFSTRTALGIYIHDAQLASTFNHDPILRHNSTPLSIAADQSLFAASTAVQWANILRLSIPEQTRLSSHMHTNQGDHSSATPLPAELACKSSRFTCYILLHGIGAAAQESNFSGQMNPSTSKKYQDALICWYNAYEKHRLPQEQDPFCLMVLFHEIFMSILVDFDRLERAIGRDGPEVADALKYTQLWSSNIEAKRCLIHASLIHRQVGSMRVDSEPAIHVPRSTFLAAIVWYCYIKFDRNNSAQLQPFDDPLEIPELRIFHINSPQHLFEASGFKNGKPKLTEASPLQGLTDQLFRIGHWGISRRFACIIGLLVHNNPDSHLSDVI